MGIAEHADADGAADTLASIGENAVLARIFPRLPESSAALVGPGDDAAVLRAHDGRFVVTTDMMVHGPDFRTAWSSQYELGWKAAATNLSDVAAMGAVPTALVVALAVPAATPVTGLEEFADGLREACLSLAPGCGVVGGDLSVTGTATIAITAFGDLQGRAPVLRSGALPGDVLAYSGELGVAGAGLRLLFTQGVDDDGVPDAGRAAHLRRTHPAELAAQLAPRPPIGDGVLAAVAGAHAMLDVSDGLAKDAARIAAASGVAIEITASALGDDTAMALAGGEDHGLLASFAAEVPLPGGFRAVGRVLAVRADGAPVLVDGLAYREGAGWDPYAGWGGSVG